MKAATILLLVLFAGSAWAQSQSQQPVPPITGETKRADKSNGNAHSKQTITVELPPTLNVTVGGKLDVQTDENKLRADTETHKWTDPLAVFTFLLVIVTAILARYTYLLWNATKTLAEDARNVAKTQAADMQSSLKIAGDTAKASQDSADTANPSVTLARDEFLATHRPRLRVRQVEFIESKGLVKGVRYTVHNAGDSDLVITEVSERLWLAEVSLGLRLMPSYRAPAITRITGMAIIP